MSTIEVMPARLTREETDDLRRAVACLEGASFAQRLTDVIGRPVELLSRAMPQSARRAVAHASEAALRGRAEAGVAHPRSQGGGQAGQPRP